MTPRLIAKRYRIVQSIDHGGRDTVWRAEDERLKRAVAVKEVHPPPELPLDGSDGLVARVLHDAQTFVELSRHPAIPAIHDVVLQDGRPWIVMELAEGHSLERVVADDGPFSSDQTAAIGRQLLSALEAVHAAGAHHRGVAPSNVLVSPDGHALLTGFSIAVSAPGASGSMAECPLHACRYIAPERLKSGEATALADVWSLRATLYYAVEGEHAYENCSAVEHSGFPGSVPRPQYRSGPLGPVLNLMMQRDPEHRLSGRTLDGALERVASGTADYGGPPPLSLLDGSSDARRAPASREHRGAAARPPEPAVGSQNTASRGGRTRGHHGGRRGKEIGRGC